MIAVLVFVSTASVAQDLTEEQQADKGAKHFISERSNQGIVLTEDQKIKVKEIFLTSIKAEEIQRKEANGDQKKFEELSENRLAKRRADLKKVLTAEQNKRLEEVLNKQSKKENITE